jgi:hypothetical protein
LSLAFEYQGEVHYISSYSFGNATQRQRHDQIKRDFATQMGITLITVPFWWKRSPETLAATIRLQRPEFSFDAYGHSTSPIPSEMPLKIQNTFKYTPNVSKEYNERIDPSGW